MSELYKKSVLRNVLQTKEKRENVRKQREIISYYKKYFITSSIFLQILGLQ